MTKPNDSYIFNSLTGDAHNRAAIPVRLINDEQAARDAAKAQPAKQTQASLAWAPYMEKATLVAKDAQLSGDMGVIARLLLAQQQRDELQKRVDWQADELVRLQRQLGEAQACAAIAAAEGRAE